MKLSRFAVISTIGYVAVLVAIVSGLLAARAWSARELGTPAAQTDWDEWRDAVRDSQDAPVTRRVPKSDEPPALKLMRDYFSVSLAMCLLLGSVLYATLLIAIKGVTSGGGRTPHRKTRVDA